MHLAGLLMGFGLILWVLHYVEHAFTPKNNELMTALSTSNLERGFFIIVAIAFFLQISIYQNGLDPISTQWTISFWSSILLIWMENCVLFGRKLSFGKLLYYSEFLDYAKVMELCIIFIYFWSSFSLYAVQKLIFIFHFWLKLRKERNRQEKQVHSYIWTCI